MTKLLKGINRDSKPVDQPQGTYRDALNSLLTKAKGAHVSEEGNELSANLGLSYTTTELGSTGIFDQRQILFLEGDGNSIIAVYNPNSDTYNIVLNDPRLNFQEGSVIEATTRIDNSGDIIVYWTDDINPPRHINIDNPPSTINNINNLNVFSFVESVAQIDLNSVNSTGGSLETGAYFFFIAYIDADGNRTNYLASSSPVYITDDADLTDTDEYDGAPPGTPTSKSVTLDISEIDENFEFIEIAVLYREGGTTGFVHVLPEIPTSSGITTYTYTGNESFTDGSRDDIIINNASYQTARTLTQIDDILYLGNLTRRPDIGYQKYANNIQVEVDSNPLLNAITNGEDNYKNAEISYDLKSYKRDEVYALYISFILNDGSETEAYHIPGRELLDANEVDDISNYPSELSEENIIDSTNGKRFHFENRSEESSLNTGFWENQDEFYPDNENWEVWDVDNNGDGVQIDSLRPSDNPEPIPVRHHRMPSLRHFPYHNEFGDIIPIGIKLNNLKIPSSLADDIKGIKLYYADRETGNRRILGQSFIYDIIATSIDGSSENFYIPNVGQSGITNSLGTCDFKMLKDKISIGGFSHLKIAGYPQGERTDIFDDANNDYDLYDMVSIGNTQNDGNHSFGNIVVNGGSNNGNSIIVEFDGEYFSGFKQISIDVDGTENETGLASKIRNGLNADTDFGSSYNATLTPSNNVELLAEEGGSFYNSGVIIAQNDGASLATNDLANGKDTGVNLSIDGPAKAYVPSGEEAITLTDKGFSNNGYTGYSESGLWFELSNDYNYELDPIRTANTSGHIGILADIMFHTTNLYNSFDVQQLINTGFYTDDINNFDPTQSGSTFSTSLIFGGDTYINRYGFRLSTDQSNQDENTKAIFYHVCESYDNIDLRHQGNEYEEIYYPKSTAQEVLELEEQDSVDEFYDNFYGYNIDYSALQNIKTTIAGNKEFGEQVTSFPTRIIRSQQDDPAEEIDRFRQFLENDFIDLPRNRGELITLSNADNILLPHMERGLFRTKGREELVTGDVRAYVGAGDIFSIKPDEINPTEEGFAGLQDQICAITTPHGYFFVDRKAGQVLLLGQGIDVISDYGLKNFFENQLEQIQNTNQLICSWDNRFERILLTLKEGTDEYSNGWTLSYYPQLKAWGSFHSYIPDYYLYDIETFYSLSNDSIYRHNIEGTPATFYGTTENTELEFVDNREPATSKVFFNLQIVSDVVDPAGNDYYDETYDQFRVFSDRQDSDIQDITTLSSLGDGSNARHVEGTWNINKFRDMLVDGTIDNNKPWYNQGRFIGKYVQVKLIFNNSDNKSLYLYDVSMGIKQSIR